MKNTYVENHFFILSKGMNAGKATGQALPSFAVLHVAPLILALMIKGYVD